MKTILCFSLVVLTIFSCDDDEKKDPLEGSWVRVTEVYSDCEEDWANETITFDDDGCFEKKCLTYHFKDGALTITTIDDGITRTTVNSYTVKGSIVTIDNGAGDLNATFAAKGDTLTFTISKPETDCNILVTFKRKR